MDSPGTSAMEQLMRKKELADAPCDSPPAAPTEYCFTTPNVPTRRKRKPIAQAVAPSNGSQDHGSQRAMTCNRNNRVKDEVIQGSTEKEHSFKGNVCTPRTASTRAESMIS
ncbi:unnamed protein product, partial [Amoebophrya sp. A25]|eukprot:GSA25T00023637001.1